jgi:hypothetical protein
MVKAATVARSEASSHASKPFFGSQAARPAVFFASSPVIQAKLRMGSPGDSFEREADAMADRVVQRMATGVASRADAPPVQAKCSACQDEEELQRKAETSEAPPGAVPGSIEQSLAAGRSAGEALNPVLRQDMEEAFESDFSGVRVHTGPSADSLNHDLRARAFTFGRDIYFNAGEFRPDTRDGRHLLAHELAHVLQQGAASQSVQAAPDGQTIQRAPDGSEASPTAIGFSVTLDGLILNVPDSMTFKKGPKPPQIMAILLGRLLGDQFKPGMEHEALAALSKFNFNRRGGLVAGAVAKGGEPIGTSTFQLQATWLLINWLRNVKKLEAQLSEAQKAILALGAANADLWVVFVDALKHDQNPLPSWYTKDIFTREMAQNGAILRAYAAQRVKAREGDPAARAEVTGIIGDVMTALYGPAMVLEAVRLDISLATKQETAGIYGALWQLPKPAKKGEAPKVTTPPKRMRSVADAILFLGYMRTQSQLTLNAETDAEQRFELVRRFALYSHRMVFSTSKGGDEEIRDQPATANAPAFPSTLNPMFQISPPLFDAALGTDHRFSMQVEFPSVYEALGRYSFNWELVRIPDDKIGAPVDVDKMKGEQVTLGDVASVRFSRDTAYAKADINRAIDSMESDLGPFGVGAIELVAANAILRYVGTGIRLFLEVLTMPQDQKNVVFPGPGLFMVRGVMSQVREGNEEVVRAPSVAYYPVLARDPDEMASVSVTTALTAREKSQKRIKEIEDQLKDASLKDDRRKELQQELDGLNLALSSLGKRLESRRTDAAKHVANIKAAKVEGDLEAAEKDLANLEKIIALREKRKVGDAEQITARFVSDLGLQIPLMLEVVDKPQTAAKKFQVYVSDVTTPKSGDDTGTGKTRDDAIVNAVKKILEGIEGYGRGRVALALSGGVRTIRIDASMGSLLSESVDNLSTVLSIAAIAAAPFTAGASLAFLIPIGLVGAIPSAYRIATRLESGTFELDLENALEIVNIAGSLIGLGRLSATSVKMMRLGRGLMIVGFGMDAAGGILMGVNLVNQINEISKLPPGQRAAALMMLIGQTMISAGVMVGGALAERAQQRHAEAKAAKAKGAIDETPGATKSGEPSNAAKPAPSADPIFEKARVDKEMSSLGKMDKDSEAKLRKDEPLRKALNDQPLAAAALKKCASACYPPDIKPDQVARLDKILSRLAETGPYDEGALKKYLHDRRDNLDKAIADIAGVTNSKDLKAWLDFYNDPKKKVEKLPPKGDPRELAARVERAHDIGVKHGTEQAKLDGLEGVGFDNPIKQGAFGQGLDDVRRKGPSLDVGDVFVVEYKGGESRLAPGQMELQWIMDNIRRLHNEGGPAGQAWARTLAKALREGRLKGVAYSTPMDGNAPLPTKTIQTWTYPARSLKLP